MRRYQSRLSAAACGGMLGLWIALSGGPWATADEKTDFSRDIRPILAEHCLQCHGPDKAEGGLRLNERTSVTARLESDLVAVVPGSPAASELVRRVTTESADERMPPEKPPLKPNQIELLRRWIAEGAEFSEHWAFRPLVKPEPPSVKAAAWMHNPIDQFVLARLEAAGVAPSPEADRRTLIKRLTYDLHGLLPKPVEVDEFLRDESPQAYERIVERLLKSPRFGERWGRHWLDMARFADSDGYEKDRARPDAYVFRDWVIEALNEDLPFDQFTIEQIAGDLLPSPRPSQLIATAFNRQTLTNEEGGVDQEEYRVAAVFDRTETIGSVWLGLTVGCARCHNHKYDPISQREYFQLFAFFNGADEVEVPLPVQASDMDAYERKVQPLKDALARRKAELAPKQYQWEVEQRAMLGSTTTEDARGARLPDNILKALEMYPEKRVAATKQALFDFFVGQDAQIQDFERQIAAINQEFKVQFRTVRTLATALRPRTTHRFNRGEFLQPAEEVQPEFLGKSYLVNTSTASDPPSTKNRLDLARWLVSDTNPLTARVAVNHVWDHLFGAGLVRTPNDFGSRGQRPTHPELLDWLAASYRADLRWSTKHLIKTIVLSATYRQASVHRSDLVERDPGNTLLYRQNRLRVEGEIVRDLALDAAGLLSPKIGGPSVFPPMPADLAKLSYANSFSWTDSKGEDRYRRGMYTFFKRTIPHPTLMTFDCPDANVACVRRTVSNTPLQALTLLNNESFVEAAQTLAQRLLDDVPGDDAARLDRAFQICLVRSPQADELRRFTSLLTAARAYYGGHDDAAKQMVGDHAPKSTPVAEAASWTATLRVLLNLDEFITRD